MHANHTLGDGCASWAHDLSHCTRCCLTGHRAVSLSLRHSASCLPDPGSLPRSGALQLSGSIWTLIGPWVHACVMYADLCAHRHEYSIWPVPLITSDRNLTLRLAAGMCVPWSGRKSRGSYEAPLGLSCYLSSLLSQARHQLCGLRFCPDTKGLLRCQSQVSDPQVTHTPIPPPFFRLGDSQKSGECLR